MKNVLLIDSGSGGVNVLKECVKVVDGCNFLLFCDDKNLPYGNKPVEELQDITFANLRNIKKFFDFEIVVLACNTLSCTCIEKVREEFSDITFVGTVPAVKPALEKYSAEEVLVLATEVTIEHNILIKQNKGLVLKPMPVLAGLIDQNLDNLVSVLPYLETELGQYRGKVKAVVLGCTHYFAIKELVKKVLGEVEIFDSANGVARRLNYFVNGENEAQNDKSGDTQIQIMTSGETNMLPQFWFHYFYKKNDVSS